MTTPPATDAETANRLFELHYDALLTLAMQRRRRYAPGDSLLTRDIVHESYLRLAPDAAWADEAHFLSAMNRAMRHVIIDYARRKLAQRRGGGAANLPLDTHLSDRLPGFSETPEQILIMADLLERLEAENPRWMQIVDARYFAGLTEDETAEALGLSGRTVRRDWKAARIWMATALGEVEK